MINAVRLRSFAASLAAALLLAATFLSCSKDPNATGFSLIPDSLHIGTLVVTSTGDTTVRVRLGGNGAQILTGKSGTYEARSVMEFTFPAYDSNAVIDSAVVSLKVRYRFPDTVGTLGFEVHAMNRTWNSSTFKWDSVAGSYDAAVAGTFLQSMAPADSVISFRLDTSFVRTWWKAGGISIMLVPSPASGLVAGFANILTSAEDTRPGLVVSYRSGATDSLTIVRKSGRVVFVATDDLEPVSPALALQAGVARRAIFRFDSLGIPPLASVTSAVFEVAVDTAASILNIYTRDSLFIHLLRRNSPPYDSLALQILCGSVTVDGQKYFRADIRSIVQQWISREPNLGVLLRAYGDFSTLDKFVLYDASAPVALQPKIRITYTLLPQ